MNIGAEVAVTSKWVTHVEMPLVEKKVPLFPMVKADDEHRKLGCAALIKNSKGQLLIGKRLGSHGAGAYMHAWLTHP